MLTILIIDHPGTGRTLDLVPLEPGESPAQYLEDGVTLAGMIPCDIAPVALPLTDARHASKLESALDLLGQHILYDAAQEGQDGTVYDALRRMLALAYEAGFAQALRQQSAPPRAGAPHGAKKRRSP